MSLLSGGNNDASELTKVDHKLKTADSGNDSLMSRRTADILVQSIASNTPSSSSSTSPQQRDIFVGLLAEYEKSHNNNKSNGKEIVDAGKGSVTKSSESTPPTKPTNSKGTKQHTEQASIQFPWKMHEMLDNATKDGYDDIVSWLPDNKSFKVHMPDAFTKSVMQRYFKQTKFKSFRRQINMWGFERIKDGPSKGGYCNPHFVRGQPTLCYQMKRMKVKGVHGGSLAGTLITSLPSTNVMGSAIGGIVSERILINAPPSVSVNNNTSTIANEPAMKGAQQQFRDAATPTTTNKQSSPSLRNDSNNHWLQQHECSSLEFARQQVVDASTNNATILRPMVSSVPARSISPVDTLTTNVSSNDEGIGLDSPEITTIDDLDIIDELICTFLQQGN